MNATTDAVTALLRTIADQLPARLRAADEQRRGRIVLPPGPYEIPAEATLELQGTTVPLTEGTRSAALVAAELAGVPRLAASADTDGRLVLESTDAPTADQSSTVLVGRGTANEVFGLHGRKSSATVLAIGDPPLSIVPYANDVAEPADGPTIYVEYARATPNANPATRLVDVAVRLEVRYVGAVGETEATLDALMAMVGELYAVVREGDGRGAYRVGGREYGERIVRVLPRQWIAEPKTWVQATPGGVRPVPHGRAFPEFDIRVWEP